MYNTGGQLTKTYTGGSIVSRSQGLKEEEISAISEERREEEEEGVVEAIDLRIRQWLTNYIRTDDVYAAEELVKMNIAPKELEELQYLVRWKNQSYSEKEIAHFTQTLEKLIIDKSKLFLTNEQKILQLISKQITKVNPEQTLKGLLELCETMTTKEKNDLTKLLEMQSTVNLYVGQKLINQVKRCLVKILKINGQQQNSEFITKTMKLFEVPKDVNSRLKMCKDRIEAILEKLPCFQTWKKYKGSDVEQMHRTFTIKLLRILININCKISTKLEVFNQMVEKKQYSYQIVGREDISNADKKIFAHRFYSENDLRDLEQVKKEAEKIDQIILKEFHELKNELANNQIQLQGHEEIVRLKLFRTYQQDLFVRQFKNNKVKVIIKLRQMCPNFVRCLTTPFCEVKQKINLVFELRRQLFKSNVQFELWENIEQKLIKEQDEYAIDSMTVIDLPKRKKIFAWIETNLVPYIDRSKAHLTTLEKAKRQIDFALAHTDAGDQSAAAFRKELIENPSEETFQNTGFLTTVHVQRAKEVLQSKEDFIAYQAADKFDANRRKVEVKRMLFKVFRESTEKLEQNVAFQTLLDVAQTYLENPKINKIKRHENLSPILAKNIVERIEAIKEFQIYQKELNRNQVAKPIKIQLNKLTGKSLDDENFRKAFELYGAIESILKPSHMVSRIIKLATAYITNRPDQLKPIQVDNEAKANFRINYPAWLEIKYQNARQKLITLVANKLKEDPKQVDNGFIKALENSDMNLESVLNESKYATIKDVFSGFNIMQKDPAYAQFYEAFRAKSVNKELIAVIELQKLIEEFVQQGQFQYIESRKTEMIRNIKAAIRANIDDIYQQNMISREQQDQIKNMIVSSKHYEYCRPKKVDAKPEGPASKASNPFPSPAAAKAQSQKVNTPHKTSSNFEEPPKQPPKPTASSPQKPSEQTADENLVSQDLLRSLWTAISKIFEANLKHAFLAPLLTELGLTFEKDLISLVKEAISQQFCAPGTVSDRLRLREVQKRRFIQLLSEPTVKTILDENGRKVYIELAK